MLHKKRDAHINTITSNLGKPVSLRLGVDLSPSTSSVTSINDSAVENTGAVVTDADEMLQGVHTKRGGDRDNSNRSKVHEYLHADRQLQDIKRVQLVCKHLDEESKVYTFKPSIPQSSHNIVNKYKERPRSPPPLPSPSSSSKADKIISRYTDEVNWEASLTSGRIGDRKVQTKSPPRRRLYQDDHHTYTCTSSSSNTCTNQRIHPNDSHNVPLENYFKQPTHTRLFNHDRARVCVSSSTMDATFPSHAPASVPSSAAAQNKENDTAVAVELEGFCDNNNHMKRLKKEKQQAYTDKLVYEYELKNKKVDELTEKLKPTFQPELYGFSTNLGRLEDHDEFITDLLRRGKV